MIALVRKGKKRVEELSIDALGTSLVDDKGVLTKTLITGSRMKKTKAKVIENSIRRFNALSKCGCGSAVSLLDDEFEMLSKVGIAIYKFSNKEVEEVKDGYKDAISKVEENCSLDLSNVLSKVGKIDKNSSLPFIEKIHNQIKKNLNKCVTTLEK